MIQISNINACEILDSFGNPTIEVEITANNAFSASVIVPNDSKHYSEAAPQLYDNDQGRYKGRGVQRAVSNIQKVFNEEFNGFPLTEQFQFDSLLTQSAGEDNQTHPGINTVYGLSLAYAKLSAQITGQTLYRYLGGLNSNIMPVPIIKCITPVITDKQFAPPDQISILPIGETFSESLRAGIEIFASIDDILKDKTQNWQGCYSPFLESNIQAIEIILKSIEKAGYNPGKDVFLFLNSPIIKQAANEKLKYRLPGTKNKVDIDKIIEYRANICTQYPIAGLQGELSQAARADKYKMFEILGGTVQIVQEAENFLSDELLAAELKDPTGNAVSIVPNRLGTISVVSNMFKIAKSYGYSTILKCADYETEDSTFSDLAVAFGSSFIDIGACTRSENVSKYNRLLKIENSLGAHAVFGQNL